MTTKEAMAITGQHQSSIQLKRLIERGWKITNLWTNGETGDFGLSIVELDNQYVWVCDNAGAFVHPDEEKSFHEAVQAAEEMGSDLNAYK